MQTQQFFDRVENLLGTEDRSVAVAATEATLLTLGQRLSEGETRDLAARVTPELAGHLLEGAGGAAEGIGLQEFLERVAKHHQRDITRSVAQEQVQAVMLALSESIGNDELRAAFAQLPQEYRPLLPDVS